MTTVHFYETVKAQPDCGVFVSTFCIRCYTI